MMFPKKSVQPCVRHSELDGIFIKMSPGWACDDSPLTFLHITFFLEVSDKRNIAET